VGLDVVLGPLPTAAVPKGGDYCGAMAPTVSQIVGLGGSADETGIYVGAEQMLNGGTASGATIESGGIQSGGAGAVAAFTLIVDGGTQVVGSAGRAGESLISAGGTMVVSGGGTAIGATIIDGGAEYVMNGGVDIDSISNGGSVEGGTLVVFAGGTAINTVVNSGLLSLAGGTAIDPDVDLPGTIISGPGSVIVNGSGIHGGTLGTDRRNFDHLVWGQSRPGRLQCNKWNHGDGVVRWPRHRGRIHQRRHRVHLRRRHRHRRELLRWRPVRLGRDGHQCDAQRCRCEPSRFKLRRHQCDNAHQRRVRDS
jgi:autotransporter passenger strand-loop-strand repeat protein